MVQAWKGVALRHCGALVVAVVCGIAVALPIVLAVRGLGDSFAGVYPEIHNDQLYYAARVQEVLEGRITLANPYFLEYKTSPWVQLWVPDALIGGALTLLDTPRVYASLVAMGFVVPPMLFLLMYACAYTLSRSRLAALLGTSLFMLGCAFSDLGRTPSPQVNLLFLLSFFWTFFVFLERRGFWRMVASGVLLGALAYIYFFFWTYALVYVGLWGLYALLYERDRVGGLLGVGLVSVCVSGYYLIRTMSLSELPYFAETSLRLGVIHSRFPSGIEVVVVGGVISAMALLWCVYRRTMPAWPYVAGALGVTAGPIVTNHHLITGLNLEFSSHYVLPLWLCVGLFFSVVCAQVVRSMSGVRREWAVCVAVLVVTAYCTWVVGSYAVQHARTTAETRDIQRYSAIFTWINTRAPRDAVILANRRVSTYIPAYTRANVVFATHASLFYLPTHDLWRRAIVNDWWEPNTTEYVLRLNEERGLQGAYFINEAAHTANIYRVYNLLGIAHDAPRAVPQKVIDAFQNMRNDLHMRAYEDLLRELNVVYLVWDRREDPHWRPYEMPFLKEEARLDSFVIYSLQ